MIGDDAPHDSQPEPGPVPDIFGRVERLEDVDLRRARYPASVVDDLDDHSRAFRVRPHDDTSTSVHGVYGVVDQVRPPRPDMPGRFFSYSLDKVTFFSLGPRMVRVFWRPEITSTSPAATLSM